MYKVCLIDPRDRAPRFSPDETVIGRYEWGVDRLTTPDGCHPWLWGRDIAGYGVFGGHGGSARAHRFGWSYYVGAIPCGLVIRHYVCDNPPCQRISHLRVGTHQDNVNDKIRKGRQRNGGRGEDSPRAKLTDGDVIALRASYIPGAVTHRALAQEFGIERSTVGAILRGDTWKHLI